MDNKEKKKVSLDELNVAFEDNVKNKKSRKKRWIAVLVVIIIAAGIGGAVWGVNAYNSSKDSDKKEPEVVEKELAEPEEETVVEDKNSDEDLDSEKDMDAEEDTELEDNVDEMADDGNDLASTGTIAVGESALTEEEMQEWKSKEVDVNGETVYIELNSEVELIGQHAFIRLINPIFSSHNFMIHMYVDNEEAMTLYRSEMVLPGTVLEAVMLDWEPTDEDLNVIVEYIVYDIDGNELGTYPVEAKLIKK